VKDKYPFLFIQHGKIEVDDMSIKFICADNKIVKIPCGVINCLILGPGTSITHEAIKTLSLFNCHVFWMGDNMLRFYSSGISPTNHTKNIYKQIDAFSKHRLTIAKVMLKSRFPGENFENKTLNQLKGLEGIRVKKLYKELSEKYNINWKVRDAGNLSGFNNISITNQYLTLLNQFLYAYVTSVIISLGYSPYIGFIHKSSSLPFTYDIADIFKKEIAIEPAFYLSKEYDFFDSDIAVNDFLDNMKKFNLSKIIPNTILNLFDISNDVTDELLNDEQFNTNILDLI
jgi:CRISPR-associated protein Cas1